MAAGSRVLHAVLDADDYAHIAALDERTTRMLAALLLSESRALRAERDALRAERDALRHRK